MKSSIYIIGNPAARRASASKISKGAELLMKKGFTTQVLMTERRGDAERFAREVLKEGPFAVIAAGGDGTINEVINGLAGSTCPLAILPLGTTNVLAKEIGVSDDVFRAMEVAINKAPRPVSLGKITVLRESRAEPSGSSRYFCLMAGIGFDGKSVHDMNSALKKVSGKAAYIFSGVKNLLFHSPEEIFLKMNGKEYQGYSAIIGKAARYGGDFRVTPDASITEPHLWVCIFQGRRRRDIFRYAAGVIVRGSHLGYDDVIYEKTSGIEISGEAHTQIDGDYLGLTPASVTVEKDSLMLIY